MQKSTIETLDLEKLSISARDFIESLSLDGFTLEQIKTLCKDRETGLSKEVHSFLCKENKCTDNTEANNAAEKSESARMSCGETLKRMFIETPIAVGYANSVINAASEVSEERCKETFGRDISAPVRVDCVCESIITMFKDPDCPVDKDKFLRGVVAFMLAHQRTQAIAKQTGKSFAEAAADFYKSNKKEESNG